MESILLKELKEQLAPFENELVEIDRRLKLPYEDLMLEIERDKLKEARSDILSKIRRISNDPYYIKHTLNTKTIEDDDDYNYPGGYKHDSMACHSWGGAGPDFTIERREAAQII